MEREQITEFLRMVLIAFAIAFVINLIRVIVFHDMPVLNRNQNTNTNHTAMHTI